MGLFSFCMLGILQLQESSMGAGLPETQLGCFLWWHSQNEPLLSQSSFSFIHSVFDHSLCDQH